MTRFGISFAALALGTTTLFAVDKNVDPPANRLASKQWGQWRGPLGTGVAPHGHPPLTWSEDKNIRWKTALPGLGHATPIVWGDHVFILTAIPHGETQPPPKEKAPGAHDNMPPSHKMEFVVLAIRRRDGSVAWKRTVKDTRPHEGVHVTGTWASNSPVTDGEHLFAYFGSIGLFCLDMNGKVLWQKDLGRMQTRHGHGEGSSPALYNNTLVINWDHQGDSFLVAFDKRTGKEKWRVQRNEITSWSTPLIVEHAGRQQVIVSATDRVRGYDLQDGAAIWECAGLSRNVVATPVAADGFVYVGNSYDWQAMIGIRLDLAKGDITNSAAVVWKREHHTPYVPSPVLYDDKLYFLRHNQGVLSCLTAKTGKQVFGPARLDGIERIFASPVGAADRVYVTTRNGTTIVVKHGDYFEILAQNRLSDSFSASAAIVDGELYLRGEQSLYCIAEERGTKD